MLLALRTQPCRHPEQRLQPRSVKAGKQAVWYMAATCQPAHAAMVRAPGGDKTLPSHMPRGSATKDEDFMAVMRANNNRMQEMLRVAQGCLKGGRCYGEPRPRDLFERWDTEATRVHYDPARALSLPSTEPIGWVADPVPLPIEPDPEDLTGEALLAKLRNDIQVLERCTDEKRQELDAVTVYLNKEVLERIRALEEQTSVQAKLVQAKRQLKQARKMFKMQELEIQSHREKVASMRASVAAAASRSESARPSRAGTTGMAADRPQAHSPATPSAASRSCSTGRQARSDNPAANVGVGMTPRKPERNELARAKSEGDQLQKAESKTAPVGDQPQSEGEKPLSVDGIAEEARRRADQRKISSAEANGAEAGTQQSQQQQQQQQQQPPLPPASEFRAPGSARPHLDYLASGAARKQKTFTSVLRDRPKSHKLYIN